MSLSADPSGSPRGTRPSRSPWVIPLALAVTMGALIAVAAFGAQHGNASAVPAPAQYSTPPPSPQSPLANPYVVAGISLGILIIVFAVLLAFRMRGLGQSGSQDEGAGPSEGSERSSSEETEADASNEQDSGSEGTPAGDDDGQSADPSQDLSDA